MPRRFPGPIAAAAILLSAAPVTATPANRAALLDYLGPAARADCRTCHVAAAPTAEAHEHNRFGARLAELRRELRKAGQPYDLRARLERTADEDSDGDGVANLAELLLGSAPGDAATRPGAAELAGLDAKRAAHRKLLAAYPWNPFAPVRRPPVPAVGPAHPVDAFLEAERREHGIVARPDAPRHVLLRRVSFDLIGLPPTPAEVQAFLTDDAPDAYERAVDRLLASPRYGERWGRHWMDVWRYSDWAGYGAEVRESLPHIWQWRDWIIESLNADVGYDRMVREMLAGDELAPDDPRTLRATGYLVRNSYKFNRNVWLDNTVEHTAKAFLGLTLNCARCHDHMYDPIAQTEYYAFRAIFEPHKARTDRVPGHADTKTLGLPRAYDAELAAPTYLFVRGNEATPDKEQPCPPAVPRALGGPAFEVRPVPLPRDAYHPDKRAFVIAEQRAAARQALKTSEDRVRIARVNAARAAAATLGPAAWPALTPLPAATPPAQLLAQSRLAVQLRQAQFAALEAVLAAEQYDDAGTLATPDGQRAAEVAVLAQRQRAVAEARLELLVAEIAVESGNAKAKARVATARDALAKAEAEAVAPLHAKFTPRAQPAGPPTSTGRRLALARWITDGQNPLAARVAVNHVWLRHFGRPLVPTVFDFGRNGQRPSHPALLDWLAAEFMDRGWSMKHLHRLLVTSRAYRMGGHADPAAMAADPDNALLWRMAPRRLEAEAVRDGVLAAAGQLNLAMGGPDLDQNSGLSTFRRSVYYRHANEKQVPFLTIFDAAGPTECYRRPASIAPQQALALANSSLTQQASRVLAARLHEEVGPTDDGAFVEAAFWRVLTRAPTAAEVSECVAYVQKRAAGGDALKARASLVHVLFNHHDFVTVR